jgi:hypothetical protein
VLVFPCVLRTLPHKRTSCGVLFEQLMNKRAQQTTKKPRSWCSTKWKKELKARIAAFETVAVVDNNALEEAHKTAVNFIAAALLDE